MSSDGFWSTRRNWPLPFLVAATLIAVLLLSLAALAPRIGLATEEAGAAATERAISVVGSATLDVPPDKAVVSLGVSVNAATAGESYSQASEVMNRIASVLTILGVSPNDVQTSQLSLYEERQWNPKTQEQEDPTYRTTSQLKVTTKDLGNVGKLVDAALEAGANSLQGITFVATETEELKNQAIDQAVDDAKAKAQRVAARLGVEVGKPRQVTVSVGQNGPVPPPLPMAREAKGLGVAADAAMPVRAGTVPFQASVSVVFDLN